METTTDIYIINSATVQHCTAVLWYIFFEQLLWYIVILFHTVVWWYAHAACSSESIYLFFLIPLSSSWNNLGRVIVHDWIKIYSPCWIWMHYYSYPFMLCMVGAWDSVVNIYNPHQLFACIKAGGSSYLYASCEELTIWSSGQLEWIIWGMVHRLRRHWELFHYLRDLKMVSDSIPCHTFQLRLRRLRTCMVVCPVLTNFNRILQPGWQGIVAELPYIASVCQGTLGLWGCAIMNVRGGMVACVSHWCLNSL